MLVLPSDKNTLIPAEGPPKGGAILLSHLPKFVQRGGVCVHVCVCVRVCVRVCAGGRGTSSNYHIEITQGHTALLESR